MPFDLCKIGQLFREAREKRGLTVDEVSDALFIKKPAICAIEEGDWARLPHLVYVKGYVSQYAAFLGLANPIQNGTVSREDDLQGSENTNKGKSGLLKLWRFRKNGQARTSVSTPCGANQPVAAETLEKPSLGM